MEASEEPQGAPRRRLIGYVAGGVVVVAAVVLMIVLLASAGDDGEPGRTPGGGEEVAREESDDEPATEESDDADETDTEATDAEAKAAAEAQELLPEGGSVPKLGDVGLEQAARAAGCELQSFKAESRTHTSDLDEEIDYPTAPPTSGKHFVTPAQDGAYLAAPDVKELVHSLEHGRVVVWFKRELPRDVRADLRALYEQDRFQTILTPDETGSDYRVAATAWNRDPVPDGTGRLLGCERFTPEAFQALRAFRDKHLSRGPELVP